MRASKATQAKCPYHAGPASAPRRPVESWTVDRSVAANERIQIGRIHVQGLRSETVREVEAGQTARACGVVGRHERRGAT